MKILIATPLWPPELGGPANYAKNLAKEFVSAGHEVGIVSFAKEISRTSPQDLKLVSFVSLKFPSGLRHFLFFCKLLPKLYKADLCFLLDSFSAGLPAASACLILRKPLILRVEGDFLWESFVERTRRDVILRKFYEDAPHLSLRERLIKRVTGWVLKKADRLVFSSDWRRAMVLRAQRVSFEKTIIIQNVWPTVLGLALNMSKAKPRTKTILWAGRMLYLKNLQRLIRAFVKVNDGSYELHFVGEGSERKSLELQVKSLKLDDTVRFLGPLPREELLEKISSSAFLILPSLSDVGPNIIAEAVSAGTPFIITRESGYAEYMKDWGLLVDPLDEDDLAAKIKILMDDQKRREYQKRLESFISYRDWKEAAQDWLGLFAKLKKQ